ncbi:hypothetical protein MBLNU457_6582t1 [Dothideomycetes sp. NU457]
MLSTSVLAAGVAALAYTVTAAPVSICGGVAYDPTMYTCASDDPVLCPIINGQTYVNCNGACYDVHMYTCTNGALSPLPLYDGPFTLLANNVNAPFNGQYLSASGGHIYLGRPQSTYCPPEVAAVADCPSSPQTVFLPGALGAIVPGGQATFIQTDGALAFTQPHSAAQPNALSDEVTVYGGTPGGYFGPGGVSWVACPVSNSTGVYQVFADLPSLNFAATCTGFDAVVEELPVVTEGAWEYI